MPTFAIETPQHKYPSVVERGVITQIGKHIPANTGKVFVVTTQDVWQLYAASVEKQLPSLEVLYFPGGEASKRLSAVEALADQMVERGADRSSLVIGFGGGIVNDVSGFLAAIFMRGLPVLQVPTTLLAQVDAAIGGKTGVNLAIGKNLIGSFHPPLAVLIDPALLASLPEREFRSGLYEVVKAGIIRDPALFDLLASSAERILELDSALVDELICSAVRIKAEVVSTDEREGDLRRILNFGHTVGHAIESETNYVRFLHGEAVGWGMLIATRLAELLELLSAHAGTKIKAVISRYGPLPAAKDLDPDHLLARLASDKKTLQGKVHFVLPVAIGEVKIVSGIDPLLIRQAITDTLQ